MAFYGSNQEAWRPSVYSGLSFFNPTSKIDKTSLSFSMWQTTLCIRIAPAIESGTNEAPKYDYKNSVAIFLTPIKAHLFAEIMKNFKNNPDQYNNHGINSPNAIITIDKPDTFGHPECGPVISIRKVNEEGNVELGYSYECSRENQTAIVGFNVESPKDFKKNTEIFKDIEFDAIITQLEAYYEAMTNATAFSVVHNLYPFLDKIAIKLGVDLSGSRRSTGGFFNNTGNGFSTQTIGNTSQPVINASSNGGDYDASRFKALIASE